MRWSSATHSAFVGRRAEFAVFEDIWTSLRAGARQAVFLGGEPGAGKSRLLAEICTALHREGAAVLFGGAAAEYGPPYQPFVDVVDTLLSLLSRPDDEPALGPRTLERLQVLAGARPSAGGDPLEREHRRQLYDAVADACRAIGDERPLVLALEDLHWAGPSALHLLTHLVEQTADSPLLIVATHRTTAPDRSDQLVHAIAQLYRFDGVRRMDLPALDSEEIADFVAIEAGIPRPRARRWGAILRDQTGGNPFFLRQLWRDVTARGGLGTLQGGSFSAPSSVRDTIQHRLDQLDAPQRQTVELGAVIGPEFELAVLLAASDWSDETTLEALDAALAHGLIEPYGPGGDSFRFPHAIARQAVLDLVPPSRRAREHARVGRIVEQQGTGPPGSRPVREVQRLAYHYANAPGFGVERQAVEYLIEAARMADRSLAHEDAAGWFARAAALSTDRVQRHELQLSAARSHLLAGDFAAARALDEQVAADGSPAVRLRAAVGYEAASWRPGLPGHRSVELLSQALREVPADPQDPLYIRAVASLGRALAFVGDTRGAASLGARALELARASGDERLLAHALQASLWHGLHPRDAPHKLARADELSRLALARHELGQLGHAAYFRGAISYLRGEPEGLVRAYEDLLRTARGTAQGFFEYMAGCLRYGHEFMRGEFRAADRTCGELLELGESFGTDDTEGSYGVQMYMLQRETGRLGVARAVITGTERPTDHWAPGLLALYTELELAEPARTLLHWLLDEHLRRYQESAAWPGVLAFLVEAALWLEDVSAARRLRPLLADYAGLNLVAGQFVALFGSADRYLGAVDSLLGEASAAEEWFGSAAEMDTRMGAPLHQAETFARRAMHLRRAGAPARELEAVTARARQIAEPLGLARVLRLLDQAAGARVTAPSGRIAVPGQPGPGGADGVGGVRPTERPDGLTAREVQVLALLAEGLINREIAERLVISENTAANHVRSILTKTGSDNRTQAAIYAAARGLV